MKAKLLLITLSFLISGFNVEAQILKKLKKKVENTSEKVLLKKTEEKTEKVIEETIDGTVNSKKSDPVASQTGNAHSNKKDTDANKAKFINTEAKRSFYTSDVIVKTSDSKGKGSEYYFDADEIAARGIAPDSESPIFIDSEGFQYAYNDSERRWEKTGLMRSDAMSFMMPMMSIGLLKLPTEPTLDASEKLKNQGLNLNTFQIVEWAFIYKPEHFRTGEYEETTAACPDGGTCPKFIYKDPEYKGSWVLFDSKNRLAEIYANVNTQEAQGDGSYKFEYAPVTVNVPAAVEVKMPFQDFYMKGLDVDPNNSNSGNRNSANTNRPAETTNIKSSNNPNEKIATVDPSNPLSFPGVTSVLEYQGNQITMELNTETMVMKLDLHDPKTKPIYFDRDNFMYMETENGCMKAKLDLEKAFTQLEEGLKDKTLPGGMDIKKMREDYYKNNFGSEAPSNFPPITGWPYIYNPEYLTAQGNFEKSTVSCDNDSCQKFTMTEGKDKGSYVLFDKHNRLQKIYSTEAKGASVTYSYPSHSNLKIPDFGTCQEIDINADIIGKMMGGF